MNIRYFAVRFPESRPTTLDKAVINFWHVMICLGFAFILSGETAAAFAPYFADDRITGNIDMDGDGYPRQFDIEFDVNSDTTGSYYVRIYEYDGGSKTVDNGGDAPGVRQFVLPEHVQPGVGAAAQQSAVIFVFSGQLRRVLRVVGPDPLAVDVHREQVVTELGWRPDSTGSIDAPLRDPGGCGTRSIAPISG